MDLKRDATGCCEGNLVLINLRQKGGDVHVVFRGVARLQLSKLADGTPNAMYQRVGIRVELVRLLCIRAGADAVNAARTGSTPAPRRPTELTQKHGTKILEKEGGRGSRKTTRKQFTTGQPLLCSSLLAALVFSVVTPHEASTPGVAGCI